MKLVTGVIKPHKWEDTRSALETGAPIFVGPIKDNTGKVVIEGTLGLYDGALWGTDYLVEGVIGSDVSQHMRRSRAPD